MSHPAAKRARTSPLERSINFSCRHVAGPMVGASDLAFRLLCRRHGADTCYTEMLFSSRLVDEPGYAERKLQTCPADRPLIVQLQGSDPDTVAAAAALVEQRCPCDAIDLNLGCPLPQAREQGFGAYLLDRPHWAAVAAMVGAMSRAVSVPITCKIRLLDDVADSIEFCNLLAAAGCSLIAVHGRRRPPAERHRGQRQDEAADLAAVGQIAAATSIPIIANGNTRCAADLARNLSETGAHGIMSCEGVLRNPQLFEGGSQECTDGTEEGDATPADDRGALAACCLEYLSLVHDYPPEALSVVRSHLMWLLGKSGKGHRCTFEHLGPYSHAQLRMALTEAASAAELEQIVRVTLLTGGED